MIRLLQVNLKLSWKQKLTIVIGITILGLMVVAGSAFMGLNSVNDSFTKQSIANEYKQNSLSLTNSLLKLEAAASSLTSGQAQKLVTDLDTLQQFSLQMKDKAASLGYGELVNFADQLESLLNDYIQLRKDWLSNGFVLGFTHNEGKLLGLNSSLAGLEKVSFAMIDETVSSLVFSQGKYLVKKDNANEKDIEKLVKDLEDLVKEMDWQDNVTGQTIAAYRVAFDDTKGLIAKSSEMTAALTQVAIELSETVAKQDVYLKENVLKQVALEADSTRKAAIKIISVASVIVSVIIFFSLGNIARKLNIQLRNMQGYLKGIAEGDFSKNLPTNDNEKDEFTQLSVASNQMVHDISAVISKVVDGNESLMSIREQLGEAVEQLAANSEEVEQETKQSTVATQQITIAVNDVAKRSVDVCETAQSASKATKTGGIVVKDCVNSMANIVKLIEDSNKEVTNLAQSSTKMLGIIDVINGLADQTNLLALNAAIESARAGEAGRGFAVVADEVRALAQKTVNATSNIGNIINGFNDQAKRIGTLMEEGVKLASSGQENANNAKSSFVIIEDAIQTVAAEMDQVVVAVEEISYNTNDIATQVGHICEQSERTKCTRRKLEDHAHHISSQAETLEKLTGRFKLSAD